MLQTDGHLSRNTRNRGKIQIELAARDGEVLELIRNYIPVKSTITSRKRATNFKSDAEYICLSVFDLEFRSTLNELGLPYGKKSEDIAPPSNFSEPDYIRGLIEGDGSLGVSATNRPFVSFTTQSESMAQYYRKFQERLSKRECATARNKRDNIYNFTCFCESAQAITSYLYYDGCLAMARKKAKAKEVLAWKRPADIRRRAPSKRWTPEQDQFILAHGIEESAQKLGRTKRSVRVRLSRIRNTSSQRASCSPSVGLYKEPYNQNTYT